jgi:tRNA A58 N-methylase Trm61
MMAVKEFGVRKAVGYEIKQDLYEDSIKEIKKQNLQNRIALIRDDLLNADLSEASVITLFLSITANEQLRLKLEREAKPSTRIVSYVHPMETWQVNSTELRPADRLYLYVVPQASQIMPDQS